MTDDILRPLRFERGLSALRAGLVRARNEGLKPPPKLTLSEWANEYAYLSRETSAQGGKFKSFKYQDGIMDAVTDSTVEKISVIKSARVGFTKILDHIAGFFIHQDPSPVLIVQPRVEDAEDYSRTEIAPMLRDTPVLSGISGDLKAKDSNQRILKRVFRNGSSISFVGANSPGGFRRITARVVCFDEVDGYPVSGAGNEGDQIELGSRRSLTFWNRKIILGSTPTVKGASRIEKSFEESDKRRYFVPCPHCGAKQTIKWANLKWDRNPETGESDTDNVYLICEANGCIIHEHHKLWMIDNGEWIATAPFKGHAGFHIWAGYSLFPNASWSNLVKEWLTVHKDPLSLRTFINLVLGETWEDDVEKVDSNTIMSRLEDFSEGAPLPVMVVTCGIDVQDDRLEVERVGWGLGEESWSLDHRIIYGDPAATQIWQELDDYLATPTIRVDGASLPVRVACIDTGGHHTATVYNYAKPRWPKVRAIKGRSDGPVWTPRSTKNNRASVNLFMVGTDAAKDNIYARLRATEPGPGYCHFPKGRDAAYFDQLTAEVVETKYVRGFPKRVYVLPGGRRNEALDLRVYAYAGLLSLNVRWGALAAADYAKRPARPETHHGIEPEAETIDSKQNHPNINPINVSSSVEAFKNRRGRGWF